MTSRSAQRPAVVLGLLLLALQAPRLPSYAVYEDEYRNDALPGNENDPRGLPNMPFSVDGNRQSDGVSSVSPLTMTSPSMPYYREGDTASTEDLVEHAYRKRRSEAEQGVSFRGAGQAKREEAVVGLFKPDLDIYEWRDFTRTSQSLHYFPNTTFGVNASVLWNPSAFAIQANEQYLIEVPKQQQWVDGVILTDADGYPSYYDAVSKCFVAAGRCRSYLREPKRYHLANWFELVCGVGNFAWKLQEAAEGSERYMPLMEDEFSEELFRVGSRFEFNATQTGELVCFANDNYGLYWNNLGVIYVRVTRTSWPPKFSSNDTTPFQFQNAAVEIDDDSYYTN